MYQIMADESGSWNVVSDEYGKKLVYKDFMSAGAMFMQLKKSNSKDKKYRVYNDTTGHFIEFDQR